MAIIPFLVGLVFVLFFPLSAPVIPLLSHPVYNKNMRVKKALEKYLGSIYPAAEVEIFGFCFCGRANIAVMSDIAFGVECQWSFVSRVV